MRLVRKINKTYLQNIISSDGLEDLSFDDCYAIDKPANSEGIIVLFLHINYRIQKKAVNRPKDQLDVIYLEKIKKLLEEDENKNDESPLKRR